MANIETLIEGGREANLHFWLLAILIMMRRTHSETRVYLFYRASKETQRRSESLILRRVVAGSGVCHKMPVVEWREADLDSATVRARITRFIPDDVSPLQLHS